MKKIFSIVFLAFCFVYGLENAEAAIIKNGTYKIQSALNSKMVLDVSGAKTANKTNIQLYQNNDTNAQKWQVTHISGDYYYIKSQLNSNKVIDVNGGSKKSGANVQIYQSNGTNAQKWLIKYAGDGYYYVVAKGSGLYLDVSGAKTKNGTNIQIYKGNKTKAQKFKFIELIEPKKEDSIEDGTYTITSKLSSKKALDVAGGKTANSTNVQLYSLNDTWSQIWNIKYLNNGYYSFTTYLNNSKALDVRGCKGVNGTNIQLYDSNGTKAQQWILKKTSDGYYYIISKVDNMYLDIKGSKTTNGTNVQLYHGNGSNAQKFKLNKIEVQNLKDGMYTISPLSDNTKSIGIDTDLAVNQSNVSIQDKNDSNGQKWNVKHVGNGYYKISSVINSNKVLDVKGAGLKAGTNIQLYESNNTNAQSFYIKYAKDGAYYIVARDSYLYLTGVNGVLAHGTNVEIGNKKEDNSQKFVFTETVKNEQTQSFENGYYTFNSALNENMVLDAISGKKANGTKIQLYSSNKSNAQIWYIKYLKDGYYSISSAMNPKVVLDTENSGMINGTKIQLYKNSGNDNQQWLIKDTGDGYVSLISKVNSLYATVVSEKPQNGTKVELYAGDLSKKQKFKLNKFTEQKVYTGIDISYHQEKNKPKIDWQKIANSDLGFVIIRAGYGADFSYQDDESFASYVAACEKYNIPYGLYLYSYAKDIETPDKTGAKDEANHMLRLLKQIGVNNYRPNLGTEVFLDVEDKSTESAGKTKLTNVAEYFCSTIESKGYKCGIYANKTWFTNFIDPQKLYPKYDIWVAEYFNKVHPSFNDAKGKRPSYNLTPYKYWQFASDGIVDGISGNVDLDLGYDIFD